MGSFGEKLRREREMRGISLDEIAVATKIGTRSLKALEDENFSILPGGIFNKGFVRAYARFLGLKEDEAVADYLAAMKEQPVSVKTIAAQSAMARANRLAAQQARESSRAAGVARALLLLVLSAGLTYGGFKAYRHGYFAVLKLPRLLHREKQAAAPVVAQAPTVSAPPVSEPVVAAVPPTTTTAVPVSEPPVVSTPEPAKKSTGTIAADTFVEHPAAAAVVPAEFTVAVKASERGWLSVVADGRRAVRRTFSANEEQRFKAKSRVRITMGNPSGTELTLNGKPLEISGDLSHPRTVVVEAGGLSSE